MHGPLLRGDSCVQVLIISSWLFNLSLSTAFLAAEPLWLFTADLICSCKIPWSVCDVSIICQLNFMNYSLPVVHKSITSFLPGAGGNISGEHLRPGNLLSDPCHRFENAYKSSILNPFHSCAFRSHPRGASVQCSAVVP